MASFQGTGEIAKTPPAQGERFAVAGFAKAAGDLGMAMLGEMGEDVAVLVRLATLRSLPAPRSGGRISGPENVSAPCAATKGSTALSRLPAPCRKGGPSARGVPVCLYPGSTAKGLPRLVAHCPSLPAGSRGERLVQGARRERPSHAVDQGSG